MKRALVIGSPGNEWHEEWVRSTFLYEAPTWTCHIAELGGGTPSGNYVIYTYEMSEVIAFAIANDYNILIHCYAGAYQYKANWDAAVAAGIAVFCAHGSNSDERLTYPPRLSSAVYVGGGDTENSLSYGPGLEMYDDDAPLPGWAESSSTPTVAGKFATIMDAHPSYNIFDGRQHLRQLCGGGAWVEDGGYGRPLVSNEPISSLNAAPPLELQASINDNVISFTWQNFLQTGFFGVKITKADGTVLYQGPGTSFEYAAEESGQQGFRVYGVAVAKTSPLESYGQFSFEVPMPPEITLQPVGGTFDAGTYQELTCDTDNATGYQWYKDGVLIEGAESSTLSWDPIESENAGSYFCRTSNGMGSTDTETVVVEVRDVVHNVWVEPHNGSAYPGATVLFTATAQGKAPLSYQWAEWSDEAGDYVDVPGATGPTYQQMLLGYWLNEYGGCEARCTVTNEYNSGFEYGWVELRERVRTVYRNGFRSVSAFSDFEYNFLRLPTSDPHIVGVLWNDSGTVKISAG
jgi:hypothetical protein